MVIKTLKPLLLLLNTCLLLSLSPSTAIGSNLVSLTKEDLSIQFSISDEDTDSKKQIRAYSKACRSLGSRLLVGKGPLGTGVFSSYSCYLGDKMIYGEPAKAAWKLDISDNDKMIKFELSYIVHSKDSEHSDTHALASLVFERKQSVSKTLVNRRLASLFSLALFDSLPVATKVLRRNITKSMKYLVLNKNSKDLPKDIKPYFEITLYHLSFDLNRKIWLPILVGRAKRIKSTKNNILRYRLKLDRKALSEEKPLWAHNSKGRRFTLENLKTEIREELGVERGILEKTKDGLIDSFRFGHVAMRYGYPLIRDDLFVSKANLFGVFTEIRGGPAKGLRFYYDVVPEVTERIDGEKYYYRWQRGLFGWSFGGTPPSFIDLVDVTPKIGFWRLDADFPSKDMAGTTVSSPMKLSFAPTAGLEIGLEKNIDSFMLFRLWGAGDFAAGFLNEKSGGSVKTLRGGTDLYFTGPSIFTHFNTSFLLFSFYEEIYLEQAKAENRLPIETAFSQAFLGAGVALSW